MTNSFLKSSSEMAPSSFLEHFSKSRLASALVYAVLKFWLICWKSFLVLVSETLPLLFLSTFLKRVSSESSMCWSTTLLSPLKLLEMVLIGSTLPPFSLLIAFVLIVERAGFLFDLLAFCLGSETFLSFDSNKTLWFR